MLFQLIGLYLFIFSFSDLFRLDRTTGILYPAQKLMAPEREEIYDLNIEVRDMNGTGNYHIIICIVVVEVIIVVVIFFFFYTYVTKLLKLFLGITVNIF